MVALKLVAAVAALSFATAQEQSVPPWAQCGGQLWTGPTKCADDLNCSSLNPWFHQCLRHLSTLPPSPIPTTHVVTTTKTTAKTTTTKKATPTKKTTTVKSTTTKKATTTAKASTTPPPVTTSVKPSTTSPPAPVQTPWGQCGGRNYVGPLNCPTGQVCLYQNENFSMCKPDPSISTTAVVTSSKTTTSITPKETFNYLFTFGDSYSQTGFDLAGTKPSVGNQLGNPALPGWTTAGGLNWVGNLLTSNPQLLSYNLASGGATTDANLVVPFAPTVLSFVDQVDQFTKNLAPAPAYAPWTAADSLFGVWIGVNDVGNAWYRPEWPTLSVQIVDQYFKQVQRLYDAGARKFVFLTVPPINRAPANMGSDEWSQTTLKAAIQTYNGLVVAGKNAFKAANAGVYAEVVDIFPKFDLILDNPTTYGAVNSSCYDADGKTCLWWNDYHPGLAIQNGVADDVAVTVGLNL